MIREAQLQRQRYGLLSTCGAALSALLAAAPALAASHTVTSGTLIYPGGGLGPNDTYVLYGDETVFEVQAGSDTLTNLVDLHDGATVDNSGTIHRTGTDNRGVVGGNGHVVNRATGVILSEDGTGVLFYEGGSVLNDGGLISGTVYGISLQGAPGSVTNQSGGEIDGLVIIWEGGTILNTGEDTLMSGGASVLGDGGAITNSGGATISAPGRAVHLRGGGKVSNISEGSTITGVSGIHLQDGGEVENGTGATISTTNDAVSADANTESAVTNTGTIISEKGKGITIGAGTVTNTGAGASITSGKAGIQLLGVGEASNSDGASIDASGDGIALEMGGTATNTGAGTSLMSGGMGIFLDDVGEATNSDGASIESDGNGIVLNWGGNITNSGGATIHSGGVGAVLWDYGTVRNTGAGSRISTVGGGVGIDLMIPIEIDSLALINEDGAVIDGGYAGVRAFDTAKITNTGKDSLITADSYGVFFEYAAGNVVNEAGAKIVSRDGSGVVFYYGGEVTNRSGAAIDAAVVGVYADGGGTITNTGARSTIEGDDQGVFAKGAPASVVNTDGATISSEGTGVWLHEGGSVYNGTGSTISGNFAGVFVYGDAVIENAGLIDGNVWLDIGALNLVTLHTGSRINGELALEDNSSSKLFLVGDGYQLYSEAVTGNSKLDGSLIKKGNGTWVLDKDIGAQIINVEAGTLIVGLQQTGSLRGTVNVAPGSIVSGSGYIYGNLLSDGIVAPGNSPGILNVVGGYVANSGSTLEIEIDPTNVLSDRLSIMADSGLDNGLAIIRPGAILDVVRLSNASYTLGTRYTIISTEDGLSGDGGPPLFDMTGDLDASAFLALEYDYDSHNAYLVVTQTQALADAATTPNKSAVAAALDALPDGSAPRNAALNAPDMETAGTIFDLLSGDLHASLPQMLLAGDRTAAIMSDRLRTDSCDAQAGDCLWTSTYGARQTMAGDGDTASLAATSGGLLLGREGDLSSSWRGGAFVGVTGGQIGMPDRPTLAETSSITAGTYAGAHNGPVALRLGTSASAISIDTHRDLSALPGIDDSDARYGALLTASFAELGVSLPAGPVTLEPFLRLDARTLATSSFTESGNASLTSAAALHTMGEATLGIHTTLEAEIGGVPITADSTLGWRQPLVHAGSATLAFDGSDSFTIAGITPQGGALASLDLTAALSDTVDLGLGYDGTFGASSSHAISAKLTGQF